MGNPLFWLAISLLLVGISLMAVLVIAIPTLREIGRAAKSFDRLCRTLQQDFPPTLDAIRLTGNEINELTEDLNEGVTSATEIVKQVDASVRKTAKNAKRIGVVARTLRAGLRASWSSLTRKSDPHRNKLLGGKLRRPPRRY
jgi:uncharacterized protein YoxC